jgi:plastocyanin
MIKLQDIISEQFGGAFLAAAMRDANKTKHPKNKFKIDPKQAKVGDEVEWYGMDKEPRVTGTISKIDSRGMEITNLNAIGTKKMDYGLKGVTINANTKYFYFGSYNKMLNHWKLKDSQDGDQNNNGFPDNSEGIKEQEYKASTTSPLSDSEKKVYQHILNAVAELTIMTADDVDDITEQPDKQQMYNRQIFPIIKAIEKLARDIEND